ncbi:polysaccharide deacetylase family protein, partial [bacterium AH-315-N22]|nr:polysaccharide deacetylase family protein [bacterium AH-315-N22]
EKLLTRSMAKGLANGSGEAMLFFRADDIGVPGKRFTQLIERFKKHNIPLCLAVVPSWLTHARFATLQRITDINSSQWCWHQHGWLHRNHEQSGKKQEFGPGRPADKQVRDLQRGKDRLLDIMGESFSPFFTPPWNRCSMDTLTGLYNLGFQAVSRSSNAAPPSPPELPDIQINIDLHTRKETAPDHCLDNLLKELELGISNGSGGIMIHHQRMNQASFDFLDLLLNSVKTTPQVHPVLFQALI